MESVGVNSCCNGWDDLDLIDINSFIDDVGLANTQDPYCYWNQTPQSCCAAVDIDASHSGATSQEKECTEIGPQKREPSEPGCGRFGTKACRERLRREKLNDRFSELCCILEPGRPVKTDKLAILGDAIRVLSQLKSEALEYKEMNEKLAEEIQALKADKNELREEKLLLKAEKERMEQQLKAMAFPPSPAGFMPPNPAVYQAGINKMAVFPSFGYLPMYHYLPPPSHDTSQDHKLRPPAA